MHTIANEPETRAIPTRVERRQYGPGISRNKPNFPLKTLNPFSILDPKPNPPLDFIP